MDDLETRVAALEGAVADYALRYAALEWVFEQAFSRYLAENPTADADAFLSGVSHYAHPEMPADARAQMPPDARARMADYVERIAQKVRGRIHEGPARVS